MKATPSKVKLTRKQAAPRNLAARALGDGRRRQKHRLDPLMNAEVEQDEA